MTIEQEFRFRDFNETQNFFMQASAAAPLGGFTVQQEYDDVILDYRRKNTRLWQLIPEKNKKIARSPTIQKIKRDKRAKVGFANRMDLSATVANRKEDLALNLNDPGQPLRALTASLDFSHFARSMAKAQGFPYENEMDENTDSMLTECYRYLEMCLFNAANTPESPHAFNGLQAQQTESGHIYRVDTLADVPESIVDTINEVCTRIAMDRNILRNVTHLVMTGAAYLALSKEVRANSLKMNLTEIVPGVRVPSIITADKEVPIISTPYLDDIPNENGQNQNDLVRIYPIDIDAIEWHGLPPDGGTNTLEPQIFDMSASMYSMSTPLVQSRFLLLYGTPYLLNEGLWRIDVSVPRGKAFSYAREANDLQLAGVI
jgi:hypothetical protein